MDKQEHAHANMEAMDTLDTKQSKQRASVKWLLSKAFNNRVPENLQEPFYRDHEDQEHLKPPIVGGLANAELYCLALANMYSDPNYHSLNHWNILQTLTRKGVHIVEPPDCALTETVLIQNNPLRMSAHMCVIEAMMVLYAREVVTLDRVSAAAQRFGTSQPAPAGSTVPHEDGLLCWINAACAALNKVESEDSIQVPTVKSLQELCDGTALAALISFYCPDALPRRLVRVGHVASLQDCLHNLMLVHDFCQRFLPHNVFHMLPEDVTYMRGSMRQNLIAMLADLFNMLEVHPVKCVKYPGTACGGGSNAHGVRHKRCLPPPPPVPIPDLRAHADDPQHAPFTVSRSPSAMSRARASGRSACSTPERRSCSPQREDFVVHRPRPVTTLASLARHPDDRMNIESPSSAAGRPSNWEDTRGATYAGRRSRRNSVSDDSQLTVENFGGSQDFLNFAGRNPEKELATVASVRKISAPAGCVAEPNLPIRTSKQDTRGSIQFFYGDFQNGPSQEEKPKTVERQYSEPQNNSEEPSQPPYQPIRRQLSSDTISLKQNYSTFSNKGGGDGGSYLNSYRDTTDGDISNNKLSSFADLTKFRSNGDQSDVQMTYNQQEGVVEDGLLRKKSTTFAVPSNTTTWQKQSLQHGVHPNGDSCQALEDASAGGAMAAQLNDIRMKLEEKRRRIEVEKQRMELNVNRQRQQVGQQAFLQAVTRDLGGETFVEPRRTPDLDGVGLEEYQQSIAKMNSSIQDIQTDIVRLASQQTQLQANQMAPPTPPTPQPYHPQSPNIPQLHGQFSSQHNVSSGPRHAPSLHNTSFGSTPHIPREFAPHDRYGPGNGYRPDPHGRHDPHQAPAGFHHEQTHYHQEQPQYHQEQPHYHQEPQNYGQPEQGYGQSPRQFYLHDNPTLQRRTWAQQAQIPNQPQENMELRGWQLHQQNKQYQPPAPEPQRSWKSPSPQPVPVQDTRTWNPQSFALHDRTNQPAFPVHYNNNDRYHNGSENVRDAQNHLSYTVINPVPAQQHYVAQSPPLAASPQRRANTPQRQGSLPEVLRRPDSVSLQQLQAPVSAQAPDDMEPQNISFIGNAEDDALHQGINRLNISSGTRTYRIPSPTRPSLNRNSFQQPVQESSHSDSGDGNDQNEKGFYISFDTDQPKRPKPPLRVKKGSPKKECTPPDYQTPDLESPTEARSPWHRMTQPVEEEFLVHRNVAPNQSAVKSNDISLDHREMSHREKPVQRVNNAEPAALVIGELTVDPNSAEEMERKKERIMMLSLQRRARAEEARARAEAAAAAKRARDDVAAEQRVARKEEQARRREAILHQYKMKKAIEEAEREGKVLDKSELESLRQGAGGGGGVSHPAPSSGAKLRNKATRARARPNTIHVDSGALQAAEGLLGKRQPSATNLTAYGQSAGGASPMRRDYYRGSQDSLADRAGLYRESPVEDRGMSPGGSSSSALGRRGSYKTSRERVNEVEPQMPVRGRSKYSTYQNNFKTGRKSSSLMNLCDSGLGRATPPRRAASPGARALRSPAGSGPPSLPGGIGKRRMDDNASDVSSTHSSIMDYSGPRLYKQPTTKSNRGIMLNAVEYCVFPGVVNREAKRRVLEEIGGSESKHFLVLFRDAGCQFRALYSYCPDSEAVTKLYGTGPKQVNDRMFDKFFKYNSGSKCFSVVHTKHLTVTIDAFTIHNSLWQGKKVQLPSKKDMALVI